MLLEFDKHNYIDVDSITVLRWIKDADLGVVIVNGSKIGVSREQFDVLEKAFKWKHGTALYNKNLKKGEQ